MTLSNYHTHCRLDDGTGGMEEYAALAAKKGFLALGFSCHAPLPYRNEWALPEDSVGEYLAGVQELKRKYAGRLEICLGMEIDYVEGHGGPSSGKFAELPLEYRIGSVHSIHDPVSGTELSIDGPVEDLEKLLEHRFSGDIKKMAEEYYRLQTAMLSEHRFDILGHCDLLKKRNRGGRFFDEHAGWYKDTAAGVLDAAAAAGVVVEVNTGGISRGAISEVYPAPWMLQECRRLHIPLTISSDAHNPVHIDYYFEETAEILKKAGYRETWHFLNGKWTGLPI